MKIKTKSIFAIPLFRYEETTRMFEKIFSLRFLTGDEIRAREERKKQKTEITKSPEKSPVCSPGKSIPEKTELSSPDKEETDSFAPDLELNDMIIETKNLEVHQATKKPKKKPKKKRNNPEVDSNNAEEMKIISMKPIVDALFTAVKANSQSRLETILKNIETEKDFDTVEILNSPIKSMGGKTLLHIAAENSFSTMILFLLQNGADPSRKCDQNVPPFRLCGSREVRSVFWNFRSIEPDKFNWGKAEVPDPSTIRETPTARKRPKKKKPKKSPENELKQIPVARNPCDECTAEINDIPFKYADFKFCTTRCLRAHRFSSLGK